MNFKTIGEYLSETISQFEQAGIPDPRLDAELLLAESLELRRIELTLKRDEEMSESSLNRLKQWVERRLRREPLQYILGWTEFWGLRIKVTPAVLIPRPETELLVEMATQTEFCPPAGGEFRILDIGTGSGCMAIALARQLPHAFIVATDLSEAALAVARENTQANGVSPQIRFIRADLFPPKSDGPFDLIVSNPPYCCETEWPTLQPEVRDYEPQGAIVAGPTGVELHKQILSEASSFLTTEGSLLMEIGEGQRPLLVEAFQKNPHVTTFHFTKDYQGLDRILQVRY